MHSLCWDLSVPKHTIIWLRQQHGLISISGNAQGSREEGPAEPPGGAADPPRQVRFSVMAPISDHCPQPSNQQAMAWEGPKVGGALT